MAEGYNYSDWGFVLPQSKVSTDEVMQHLVAQKQQEKVHQQQLNLQEQHRNEQRQQQNANSNLRYLDDATNPANYKTAEESFDNYSLGELQNLQKEFTSSEYTKLDPTTFQSAVQNKMANFLKWHGTVQGVIKQNNNALSEWFKDHPAIRTDKAHQYLFDQVAKDAFVTDENGQLITDGRGQFIRKNADLINPHFDYMESLNKPEVIGQLMGNNLGGFDEFMKSLPKGTVKDEDIKSIKGYKNGKKYGATLSNFEKVMQFDKDGTPQIDIPHEVVGNDKLADKSLLDIIGRNEKGGADALYGMWHQYNQQQEQQLRRPLSDQEKQYNLRKLLYDKAKPILTHNVETKNSYTQPKISVNVRGGGGSQINNTYGRLASSTPNGYVGALKDLDMTVGDNADIMEYAKKNLDQIEQKYVTPESIIVKKDQDGNTTRIFYKNGKNEEVYLGRADFRGLNRVSNKSMGTKTKQQIETESKATDNQQPKYNSNKKQIPGW